MDEPQRIGDPHTLTVRVYKGEYEYDVFHSYACPTDVYEETAPTETDPAFLLEDHVCPVGALVAYLGLPFGLTGDEKVQMSAGRYKIEAWFQESFKSGYTRTDGLRLVAAHA